ncbi:MAG: hypothetical protein C5S48_03630 [Candidatus Methanogaster sp.]|nr:MAG: hypothetical protein C5S48_03630 [ANME-2 cluster archaeon]
MSYGDHDGVLLGSCMISQNSLHINPPCAEGVSVNTIRRDSPPPPVALNHCFTHDHHPTKSTPIASLGVLAVRTRCCAVELVRQAQHGSEIVIMIVKYFVRIVAR